VPAWRLRYDARFTLYDDGCTMSTRRGRWRVIARVDTPTLQYANMVALYGTWRQLWVMMMSRVVSWSWQTRALRRAAGNCVLYTYTTK
jgi:hypothetical protein